MKKVLKKLGGARKDTSSQMDISGPSDLLLNVPRPRLDANGKPIRVTDHELSDDVMRVALSHMARYIHERHQSITVITIGGAVNLLLLRSRPSTHDVDFFGTNLDNNQRILLDEAARYAESQSASPLGAEWFNNQTQMWLSPDIHRHLTAQALEQKAIVFQAPSLTLLAAPWRFAFAAKANRLAQTRRGVPSAQARPYDAADAAAYLRHHIQGEGGRPQTFKAALAWCQEYRFQVELPILRQINDEYKKLYGAAGLV